MTDYEVAAQMNSSTAGPGVLEEIRDKAKRNGALDPASLRFRVVEYQKTDGEFVAVHGDDMPFRAAVTAAMELMQLRSESHFCLQPVGYMQ